MSCIYSNSITIPYSQDYIEPLPVPASLHNSNWCPNKKKWYPDLDKFHRHPVVLLVLCLKKYVKVIYNNFVFFFIKNVHVWTQSGKVSPFVHWSHLSPVTLYRQVHFLVSKSQDSVPATLQSHPTGIENFHEITTFSDVN